MSLLPPTSFVTQATGSVMEQFNYFARPITIYKQSQETIVNQPVNLLEGYDVLSQSNNSNITLSSVSQTFSGLIIYPFKLRGNSNSNFDNKLFLDSNKTYLKVKKDCSDFIYNGMKTEKIETDGLTYNIEGTAQVANFLNLRFYYYQIKATT